MIDVIKQITTGITLEDFIILLLYAFVPVYGIMFGIRNWIGRIYALITSRQFIQSTTGQMMDLAFMILLVVFVYLHLIN